MTRLAVMVLLACATASATACSPTSGDGGADAGLGVDPDAFVAPTRPNPSADAEAVIDCAPLTTCGVMCTDLDADPDNCGACGRTCVIPSAVAGCAAGECVILACDAGTADTDGNRDNGCEAGGAGGGGAGGGGGGGGGGGTPDPDPACTNGTSCMTTCGSAGMTVCMGETATCPAAAETCNNNDDNCDGTCDEGVAAGCRIGVHRAYGDGHLYTTDLGAANAAPFTVESQNYFRIYAAPGIDTRPVFLCRKRNGKHLLTDRTDCESMGSMVATLGYWSATERCGAVPLYRLHAAGPDAHFYTLSAAERDNAQAMFGYVSQGIAGWVSR